MEHEHVVRLDQGESRPASLEADEERFGVTGTELIDDLLAMPGRAVEIGVRDLPVLDDRPDGAQVAGKSQTYKGRFAHVWACSIVVTLDRLDAPLAEQRAHREGP